MSAPTKTSYDTVIIGGGIAGTGLAHYLSADGATDILLVEGNELASGCTGGSLGGVRQQFSTPMEIELGLRGKKFWSTFEQTFDSACPYHQEGYLFMTGNQEVYDRLVLASATQLENPNAGPSEMIDGAEIERLFPYLSAEGLIGACWTPEDGRVNPTDGVYGLAKAARSRGVTIKQHWPVREIAKRAEGWTIVGPETVTANRVIVASGIGTRKLLAPFGIDVPLKPMTLTYAFTTPIISDQHLPMVIDLDTGLCLEREQDAAVVTVLLNETPEGYTVEDMMSEFHEAATVRAPLFTDIGIRTTISADVDLTGGDGHPWIGEVEDGLWVLAAFDGHGTMMGAPAASLLVDLMAGRTDPVIDMAAFDPHRAPKPTEEWMRAARK